MPLTFPQHDELFIISDIHLGGESGFQIFRSTDELAELILCVARSNANNPALVINGDFVDFLAEPGATHFNPSSAIAMLDRISADPAFEPIFDSLRELLCKSHAHLIINLGNHDLELALPWVRDHLTQILCRNDIKARDQLTFITNGTGYRCNVGRSQVLCVHGNEVDDWNLADYETIRRTCVDAFYGTPLTKWVPNAGSRMVIELINEVKREYPFIDLIKPERAAAAKLLVAINPDYLKKILTFMDIKTRNIWDSARHATGFLGIEDQTLPPTGPIKRATISGTISSRRALNSSPTQTTATTLMDDVEHLANKNVTPLEISVPNDQGDFLGIGATLISIASGNRERALRQSLENLASDHSFDYFHADPDFSKLDEQVAPAIDFLVAGHTHLPRSLRRNNGNGHYFNGGAWAMVFKIADSTLQDDSAFKRLLTTINGGSIATLVQCTELESRPPTYVHIRAETSETIGELRIAKKSGNTIKFDVLQELTRRISFP